MSSDLSGVSDSTGSSLEPPGRLKPRDKQRHLELAGVVKGVHAKLRKKFREYDGDFDYVWKEHCQDHQLLSEYADAMHHLAVDHWNKHPETRIHWCRNVCLEFFHGNGLRAQLEKDERRARHKHIEQKGSGVDDVKVSEPTQGSSDTDDCDQTSDLPALAAGVITVTGAQEERRLQLPPQENLSAIWQHHNLTKLHVWKDCEGGAIYDADDEMGTVGPGKRTPESPDEFQSPHGLTLKTRPDVGKAKGGDSLCPGGAANPAPEAKCREFMERMDLHSYHLSPSPVPGSDEAEDGAADDAGAQDLQAHKQALYAKYGPTKYNSIMLPFSGKIRLLDVGSCFNPFLEFDEFLAVGIDISPAVESVYHCDFLHLEMPEALQLAPDTIDTILSTLRDPVKRLPRETFHVVVFSLLLEYFPSTYQRWVCCQRAHSLLMLNGLLIIITPDSQHQNRNAPMMKSWKRALEAIGFRRCKYVKQDHLHCMAFRKVTIKTCDTLLGDIGPDLLYIPQDHNSASRDPDSDEFFENAMRSEEENVFVRDTFLELPDLA